MVELVHPPTKKNYPYFHSFITHCSALSLLFREPFPALCKAFLDVLFKELHPIDTVVALGSQFNCLSVRIVFVRFFAWTVQCNLSLDCGVQFAVVCISYAYQKRDNNKWYVGGTCKAQNSRTASNGKHHEQNKKQAQQSAVT